MKKYNVYIVTDADLIHIDTKETAEEAIALANDIPLGYLRTITDEGALAKVSDGEDYIYSTPLN